MSHTIQHVVDCYRFVTGGFASVYWNPLVDHHFLQHKSSIKQLSILAGGYMKTEPTSRRNFLKTTFMGSIGLIGTRSVFPRTFGTSSITRGSVRSRVSLTHGESRADITIRGLRPFADEVSRAIGNRRVVIKPNNVSSSRQLAATHAETIEGILEFLKSINKLDNVVIAESAAGGPSMDAFENFGYDRVAEKYNAGLIDLDQEEIDIVHVFDETDFQPHAVRMSKLLLDPNTFIISSALLKTHDRVIATLSLKNIIFGAAIKDLGFDWGPNRKPGTVSDKQIAHGGGYRGINYNLFAIAQQLHPHLSVIDGFEGMEGNGPTGGDPVDHRVCVVSPDWLAADRVGIELMGLDFADIGYLNYCAGAKLGEADLNKMEIIGEPVERHIKSYAPPRNVDRQLVWKNPVEEG